MGLKPLHNLGLYASIKHHKIRIGIQQRRNLLRVPINGQILRKQPNHYLLLLLNRVARLMQHILIHDCLRHSLPEVDEQLHHLVDALVQVLLYAVELRQVREAARVALAVVGAELQLDGFAQAEDEEQGGFGQGVREV
jgi:hypothetical protein